MISLLGSEKLKTYPLNFITWYVADNADVNILFNYFPKQIDDAKTVFEQLQTSTQEKYILIYWW
jgi:heptosyltransferase-2